MIRHSTFLAARAVALLLLAGIASPAGAQSAEERLDQLEARITRLEDMNAIERLQKAYGYFVDESQWTRLSELFAEDATLEIGGKGIFLGRPRVLEYMQTAFGAEGAKDNVLAQHMQFQPIPDISADGKTGWVRSRAFVMSNAGWGLPLYENEYKKGEDGVWRISRLSGPFTMYTNWEGWGKNALNNTWPDKFDPPPDLPPSTVYLTYPAYYIVPFHYPNPVTGKPFVSDKGEVGAYHRPPGTAEQAASLKVGRLVDGTQAIAEPPRD
jgi:outer membrane murein-binding lipoprotein Lpp